MRPFHALLLAAATLSGAPALAQTQRVNIEPPPRRLETRTAFSSAKTGPAAIGVDADVYCSGWLGETDERFFGRVASAEKVDTQSVFGPLDRLYLDIGNDRGVQEGQEFWICRPDTLVAVAGAPEKTLGRLYRTPARAKVVCVQERSSIAVIVSACDEVEVGDMLLPFEPIPIPLVRRTRQVNTCDPPSGRSKGHIVHAFDGAVSVTQHSIVYLDLGDRDGLTPGDFLTVFRTRHAAGATRTLLGEAAILMTRDRTAVAKIMVATDAILVGDEVELK